MARGNELISCAVKAHGGWDHWNPVKEIAFRVRTTGLALATRFRPFGFGTAKVKISPRFPKVLIDPFPRKGFRGIFERDRVSLERADGSHVKDRSDPGTYFHTFRRKLFWDHLDLLYFGGFAFWNYINLPFLLDTSGVSISELDPVRVGGEEFRRVSATFPEDLPTHSRDQVFYLNREGLIIRHDYIASSFGKWARAAHYSSEFIVTKGLVIPTRRVVYPRTEGGQPLKSLVLVHLEISDIEVERL